MEPIDFYLQCPDFQETNISCYVSA